MINEYKQLLVNWLNTKINLSIFYYNVVFCNSVLRLITNKYQGFEGILK